MIAHWHIGFAKIFLLRTNIRYQGQCGHQANIETTSCESLLLILLSQRSVFPPWSLSFPSEPVFNIDHEIFLPQAPDKSCIHRSLLIWSPRLNVFCRRLETCTTSSWWASDERRRWRCLTTTWRTRSTARTRRTQVPNACAWSRFEPVRVRDSCSPEDESQRALRSSDGQTAGVSEWMAAPVSPEFVEWKNTKVQLSVLRVELA